MISYPIYHLLKSKLVIIGFLMLLPHFAYLQESELRIIDLGNIKEKNQDVVDLVIRNPYDHSIELIEHEAELPIQFQARNVILPPRSYDFFRVKIGMNRTGYFKRKLRLAFDDPKANVEIEFVGNVKKLSGNELQKCPSFDNLPSSQKLAKQQQKLNSNIQLKFLVLGDEEEDNRLSDSQFKPNNIVFLLDVSSSMRRYEKLDLLKSSMGVLISSLRSKDKISLITYDTRAKIVINSQSVQDRDSLRAIIDSLQAQGATNAIDGIDLAIETLDQAYISGGNNQLYLVSDGAFLVDSDTKQNIRDTKKTDLSISVLAIKSSKGAKKSLKSLSKLGNGKLLTINSENDKDKILNDVKRMSAY